MSGQGLQHSRRRRRAGRATQPASQPASSAPAQLSVRRLCPGPHSVHLAGLPLQVRQLSSLQSRQRPPTRPFEVAQRVHSPLTLLHSMQSSTGLRRQEQQRRRRGEQGEQPLGGCAAARRVGAQQPHRPAAPQRGAPWETPHQSWHTPALSAYEPTSPSPCRDGEVQQGRRVAGGHASGWAQAPPSGRARGALGWAHPHTPPVGTSSLMCPEGRTSGSHPTTHLPIEVAGDADIRVAIARGAARVGAAQADARGRGMKAGTPDGPGWASGAAGGGGAAPHSTPLLTSGRRCRWPPGRVQSSTRRR